MSDRIILTIVLRHLRHSEGLLAELDHPLAREAYENVHAARMNMETLDRLETRKGHVLGQREAA